MNNEQSLFKRLQGWLIKLTEWGFFCIAMLCFLLVGLMIFKGDVWAYIIYAEKPIPHFMAGVGALFSWYFLKYGMHNTRNEWLTFIAKILLLTLSLSISLVAGEIILRKFYSIRQDANSMERFKAARKNGKPLPVMSTHPLAAIIQPSDNINLAYELQPGLDIDFGHKRVRINSDGMRKDREYPAQKSSNSIRIIGVGDSGMFGWNTEQNENYLDVLEVNLNKRKDGTLCEVLNLAVPGYNTQLEVEMLRSRGLKFKPDIVIVGWCENDYSLPFFMLEKENYRRLDISFVYNLLFKRSSEQKKRTQVAPGFKITDQRDFDKDNVLTEWTTGNDVDRVKNTLKELKRLSEQNKFKALVFGPMKNVILDICKEIGIPFSNTYDLIPRDEYPQEYLIHFMHPTKEGHAILAEYLEADLVKRGWLEPK